jgi:hypothetical protein
VSDGLLFCLHLRYRSDSDKTTGPTANPSRLEWCLNAVQIDINQLSTELKIAQKTLDQAMESKEAFSVNQLEKIANYFKRNLR